MTDLEQLITGLNDALGTEFQEVSGDIEGVILRCPEVAGSACIWEIADILEDHGIKDFIFSMLYGRLDGKDLPENYMQIMYFRRG